MRSVTTVLSACAMLMALQGPFFAQAHRPHHNRGHHEHAHHLRAGGPHHHHHGKGMLGRMGGDSCAQPYRQCWRSCAGKTGIDACDCYNTALQCMQSVRERFRNMPFGCTEDHAHNALTEWQTTAKVASCSEEKIPQLRASGDCNPSFPTYTADCTNTMYTHFTTTYSTAWFPSAYNFSQLYSPTSEPVLQMQVCLDAGDQAGIDVYFKHNGVKISTLKLEPSGSGQTCSAKYFTSPWSADISDNQKTDQWFIPNDKALTDGATWSLEIHNRNWIHDAHVQAKFALTCGALGKPMGTDVCTEQKLYVYRSPVDASNPVYVTGGCAYNQYGPTPPNCANGAKFCCANGNSPSSSSVCGENCFDCKNSC